MIALQTLFYTFLMMTCSATLQAQLKYPTIIGGKEFVPRGYVVITEDNLGDIEFTPQDYFRMAKMGANYQVVRLAMGRLGGYPGNELESDYISKLNALVRMGKDQGIRTVFKMTVYGAKDFDWGTFWKNESNEHELLVQAWTLVWEQFKDESYVMGYDLLNEPHRGEIDVEFRAMEENYLVPLLQRLIDESQSINSNKICYYQPLLFDGKAREEEAIPFQEMTTPLNREGIVFTPHIYEYELDRIAPTIERYLKEATVSNASMFMGEWGNATFDKTDASTIEQYDMEAIYMENAAIFDRLGLGTVKAWFAGTRYTIKKNHPNGPYTWSMFSDKAAVGTAERKYIVDVICRPYPQEIDGRIQNFAFDFATRIFSLEVKLNTTPQGVSRIYVPQDRHYPDGYTIELGDSNVLQYNPYRNSGIEVVKAESSFEGSSIAWDAARNQLLILQWPQKETIKIKIRPGIFIP